MHPAQKPHYHILDGLRGVAALMVLWYHIFEGFAKSPSTQVINHGYLAVDFFFMLSGFVIGYAYDDRWPRMTTREFFTRRLIRLHPMMVAGVLIGVVAFIVQGCVKWDGTPVGPLAIGGAMLLNLFLIPSVPGAVTDVRGNTEIFSLNGPHWSLFFEYVGNILYGLVARRLSTRALGALTALLGLGLGAYGLANLSTYGNLGVGWSFADHQILGGMLRMTFSFSMGLLLSRVFRPARVKGAFWICSAAVIILLATPYIGDPEQPWQNALYDTVCILLLFPAIVYTGASGSHTEATAATAPRGGRLCRFVGDISYPLYAIHYPSIYLLISVVWAEDLAFTDIWWAAIPIVIGNIALAWMFMKWYDAPLRARLTARFLRHGSKAPETDSKPVATS